MAQAFGRSRGDPSDSASARPFPTSENTSNIMADRRQPWLTCVVCETGFEPVNQVQLTCSEKCSRELAVRRTAKWRRENRIPALPATRKCQCDRVFKPRNITHKSCSRECASTRQKKQISKWRVTHARKSMLKHKYGLTHEDYERMYQAQDGRCAICKQPFDNLCVDHNHKTGRVRGLLCVPCNAALGSFKDDVQHLRRAILYLEQYKEQNE